MPDFVKFSQWKKQLLARRELNHPDGRALYSYRLTKEEFDDLEQLLKSCLNELLPSCSLVYVVRLSNFAELFVLYAAEWWRRRYDGSGFSWEPILGEIGAVHDELTPTQRSDVVRNGFRGWRIHLIKSGGMRFIGSVAVQGGLPLKLLAKSRGSIGQMLSQVLNFASGTVTKIDIQNWIKSLEYRLPQSYRQETIYTLLADVAWTVLRLKEEANLQDSSDAVSSLDKKIPGWRERFPLPVEDEYAQGMIEQLMRDVAGPTIIRQKTVLPVERLLERTDGCDEWNLSSNLVLADVISYDQLLRLFSINADDLPRRAQLSLHVRSDEKSVGMRRLAGHQKYRLERTPIGFSDDCAAEEHQLRMASPDGRTWVTSAHRGDELDSDLPWVFIEQDSRVLFVRQGGGTVAAQQAIVALPQNWQLIKIDPNSEIREMGTVIGLGRTRRIVGVRGDLRACAGNGTTFRLRIGCVESNNETYVWKGNRYWLDFHSPILAFRGMPELYRADEDNSMRVDGQLGVSFIGGSAKPNSHIGLLHLRYPASGDIIHRSKVLVLPNSAKIELKSFDGFSGAIRFRDWAFARVCVTTLDIGQSLETVNDDAILNVSVKANQPPPEWIECEAYWLHSTTPAKFRLPFPARGVRMFDSKGGLIENNSLMAVQQLHGVRVKISCEQMNFRAAIKILDNAERHVFKHPLQALPDSLSMEIRMLDYLSDIQQLLSISDSPNTRVKVQIEIQRELMFTLLLARYSATLEGTGNSIQLDMYGLRSQKIEDLESLSMSAVRLESPGDEESILEPCSSEGVATGNWLFSPQLRQPGSWIVYPKPWTKFPFCPALCSVDGDVGEGDGLSAAFSLADTEVREQYIDNIIERMASDFCNEDWQIVEQLARQIGHLPLTTLDIWKRFVRSPQGMAAIAVRYSSLEPDFIARFAQELPFAWETIAFENWQAAMYQLAAQCENFFGKQNGPSVLQPYLSDRIEILKSWHGSLAFLLGIAAANWLPDARKESEKLKIIVSKANKILFEGFEGQVSKEMALMQLHANDEWPNALCSELSSVFENSQFKPYLREVEMRFRTWTINVPIILAVQAVTGQTTDWFNHVERIFALRNYQAFDLDWFEDAYNWTVAHCFADGLIDEATKP